MIEVEHYSLKSKIRGHSTSNSTNSCLKNENISFYSLARIYRRLGFRPYAEDLSAGGSFFSHLKGFYFCRACCKGGRELDGVESTGVWKHGVAGGWM
jgi:hypothetical protein